MSYSYQTQRQKIFTEAGTKMLLAMTESARALLERAGAFDSTAVMRNAKGLGGYDSWDSLAVLDYLVETKCIREVTPPGTAGQDRVFVAGSAWR